MRPLTLLLLLAVASLSGCIGNIRDTTTVRSAHEIGPFDGSNDIFPDFDPDEVAEGFGQTGDQGAEFRRGLLPPEQPDAPGSAPPGAVRPAGEPPPEPPPARESPPPERSTQGE